MMLKKVGQILLALAVAAPSVCGISCARAPRRTVILCAGDSLTEHGYPVFLQNLLRRDGVAAVVLNYGRSGFTSGEYLRFLGKNKPRLLLERPDVILLELGTNDVRRDGDATPTPQFERNMKSIIGVFRDFRTKTGRPPALLLAAIPPIPEGEGFPFSPESGRRVRDEINPALRRIAGELDLAIVDQYTLFTRSPQLLPEVHPSPAGYREMARGWYRALKPHLRTRS